ncbi:UspA domain-containing protein [Actinoplanes sp. SE50]|uniref:universal stress protein n=1 Tax=unclassified Actinoplanes TaxID=2626549 RepID=UPI00023ED656|nr:MULTISPECIES: universal stress protein [unclassified Actinoplanes]AEV86196.1 UspA domain-containing protein [Actinoplanes sp. SE50/110]ATO84594.1 UspA domain-containing protein [Actinoplanes sp. SE50]SLM02004.1 UspA domain-containing protein [Actinoplanes sp. SE50/110]
MRIPNQPPVVAGVAGTAGGLSAVRLAAREAVSRGTQLSIVHAFAWDGAEARRAAAHVVEEAVATAQRCTPGADVRGQLVDGSAGSVLRRFSRTAALLVVGATDLPTSSLLEAVTQAWCPVLVARGARPAAGPVLAAVDGSGPSVLALRHAAAEAVRRGLPLEVAGDDDAVLDRVLAGLPDLPSPERRLLTGDPAGALVRLSQRVALLALGPRGAGGAARFGSVAHELLRHGGCPTVFVHGRREPLLR